ncbi:MAG: hypothetical protein ACI4OI_06915 [Gemmiger sp.]
MKTALMLGKGGFGTQLAELLVATGRCDEVLFLDDNAPDRAGALRDFSRPALRERCSLAFVGLGNNALRVQLLQELAEAGYTIPVFVHPAAVVSPSAVLGPGTVVLPFAYVGAGVRTGMGCILNAGSIVDHNASLGDGVHAAPGAIIKAGASVPACTKIDSGEIIASPW